MVLALTHAPNHAGTAASLTGRSSVLAAARMPFERPANTAAAFCAG